MGTVEKLIGRLTRLPSDFTFDEVERILSCFGDIRSDKCKTSGSRVLFMDGQGRKILLHRPHPGNKMKVYALKQLVEKLTRNGNL